MMLPQRWNPEVVKRIDTLLKRRKAAAELGVRFQRCASFRLPHVIKVNGRLQRLSLPEENGIKVAFIELLLDDCYGCGTLERRGDRIQTVLDIGGNVGLFGLAARNAFPGATIHCYEPNKLLEPYLSVQAVAAEFTVFMEAVGRERGMIDLDRNEDSVQTRSRSNAQGDIPQIAFREAIERLGGEVDLLKMDCEGQEWELFKDKESWRHIRHLTMEYHLFTPGNTEQEVKDNLTRLGFRITYFDRVINFGLVMATRNG